MQGIYITFDEYYDTNMFNSFLQAAKNNNIEYRTFVSIKPPYKWHIKLEDKKDLPKFINFDYSTKSEIRWLVSTIRPVDPKEAFLLKRRPGEDNTFIKFIAPLPFRAFKKKKYFVAFKNWDFAEMRAISTKLGKVKIYKWGKGKIKRYNIWYCFNPMIKQFIPSNDRFLLEFGKEALNSPAQWSDLTMPENYGMLEYYLNTNVLIKEKLEDKYLEAPYWYNGKYFPLKKESFL